jgi:hypothetical protein
MKKMFLAVIVFLMAQTSFAGFNRTAVETTVNKYASRIKEAKERKGNDFTQDVEVKKAVTSSLNSMLEGSKVSNIEPYIKLINNDSTHGKDVLMKIAELSSTLKEYSGKSDKESQDKVDIANKALELLSLSAKKIELIGVNEAQGQAQAKAVANALIASPKIASFIKYKSETAKEYAKVYERSLEENKNLHESMTEARLATKDKVRKEITEEDILSCIL